MATGSPKLCLLPKIQPRYTTGTNINAGGVGTMENTLSYAEPYVKIPHSQCIPP